MTTGKPTPVLMLSTTHPGHSGKSGYGQLAHYVPGAEFLTVPREQPKGGLPLFSARVARRLAFSRWYIGGSAALEWKAVKRLRKGFDGVVHSMWADHDLGFLDLVLNKKRHKFCGTFHNCSDDFQHTIRFPSRLRNFDAVILMSETQRPFFLQAGVPDEKIHVVLHGVDTEYFIPGKQADTTGTFTVLSVGGFRRNFPLLRKVCERLASARNMRFKIIAPEAWREMFAGLANVDFLSGVDDAGLLAAYQSASCLLHTAENATANNALLEAMACGLPVVAESIGGIPEYINGDNAMLVEPGNDGTLAGALKELMQSPALHSSMRLEARKHAETLAWPLVAGRMMDIYQTL
jgi:glycosyltransferase involved in cell wall biosynthesis